MKKIDRAMYAIFLLALLADVARSRVPAPVGDSAGGLILSAANQLSPAAAVGPSAGGRRSETTPKLIATRPVAERLAGPRLVRLREIRSQLAGWARVLSRQANEPGPVMLAALASGGDAGAQFAPLERFRTAGPSIAVFEHSGSPAP